MAAKAVVGALRIVLAMDAAEFRKGAEKAGSALNQFAKKVGLTGQNIKRGLLAIGAAAAAMAAAIGVSVNRTLGEMDCPSSQFLRQMAF